ncbi:MAG: hypothetical protein HKN23_10690 [Verrucomicrobiales bacterium]|nr:hypothetical protein [Verrucomicrobiales bacterium]
MKAFAAFLLIPLSMIIYIILATGMGIYQRYPIVHFVIIAVGLVFLGRLIFQKFTIWRLLLNLGGWVMAGFFVWWTLSYSNYGEYEAPVASGETAPRIMEAALKNSTGEATTLANVAGDSDGVVLIFYRGHW